MLIKVIVFLLIFLFLLFLWWLLKSPTCDHAEQIFYDAAGDELPGEASEACFCTCLKCGRRAVIPSGFQGDAHFENYLQQREQGGSQAEKKIKGE